MLKYFNIERTTEAVEICRRSINPVHPSTGLSSMPSSMPWTKTKELRVGKKKIYREMGRGIEKSRGSGPFSRA